METEYNHLAGVVGIGKTHKKKENLFGLKESKHFHFIRREMRITSLTV